MNKLTLAFMNILGVTGRKILWHSIYKLTGIRLVQPVGYPDWAMFGAEFPAPTAALREVLPSTKLKPVEINPGIGTVHLVAVDFRQAEIFGPYKELQLNIPVVYKAQPGATGLEGDYVYKLPITSEEACRAGLEISGFPKFEASVVFEDDGDYRCCTVSVEGKHLITLQIEKVPNQPKIFTSFLYSVIDGHLLRTPFQHRGEWGSMDGQIGASFILGDHPITRDIACLGMEPTPIRRENAPRLSSILQPPEKLSL